MTPLTGSGSQTISGPYQEWINQLSDVAASLAPSNFFGSIQINFSHGNVVNVNVTDSYKPTTSTTA